MEEQVQFVEISEPASGLQLKPYLNRPVFIAYRRGRMVIVSSGMLTTIRGNEVTIDDLKLKTSDIISLVVAIIQSPLASQTQATSPSSSGRPPGRSSL